MKRLRGLYDSESSEVAYGVGTEDVSYWYYRRSKLNPSWMKFNSFGYRDWLNEAVNKEIPVLRVFLIVGSLNE